MNLFLHKRPFFLLYRIIGWLLVVSGSFLQVGATEITSAGDGAWKETSTWVGGSIPGINDTVIIATNHLITIDSLAYCKKLTLQCEEIGDLTIVTLEDNKSLTVLGDVEMVRTDGAVLQIRLKGSMTINGDLIYTNTTAPFANIIMDYNTNPELILKGDILLGDDGEITSSASNPSTVKFNGTSAQNMTLGSALVYNHVIIDNPAGVTMTGAITNANVLGNITVNRGTLSNGGFAISGNDSTFEVKANASFVMEGTTGLPSTYTHVFSASSNIEYAGSSNTIDMPNNSQVYGNLEISGTGTKTLGENLDVNGDLTLTASTLDLDNTSNYSLNIAGDWIMAGGSLEARAGEVIFDGSTAQAINGSSNPMFYDLEVNNTSSTGLTLNTNSTIENVMTFNDGYIYTGTGDTLIISNTDTASVTGHSSASYVAGRMRRSIASNTNTYAFPVGTGGVSNYQLSEVQNNLMTGTTYLHAEFTALTNHDNNDMNVSDAWLDNYSMIATEGVWIVHPDIQPTGGDYSIKLYTGNLTGLVDNSFGVLKRPVNSITAADWTSGGGTMNAAGMTGRLLADGFMVRKSLTSFSQFGGGGGGDPLPIELLSFDAILKDGVTLLEWLTATEINNDYFTIERSTDGQNFEAISTIKGAGTSSRTNAYTDHDEQPLSGKSYYRLKQTDYDGEYSYSQMVSINNDGELNSVNVTVFPNPLPHGEDINIRFVNPPMKEKEIQINIFELATGKKILSETSNNLSHIIILTDHLPPGYYLLQGSIDDDSFLKKISVY